jgi:hypothetical protein
MSMWRTHISDNEWDGHAKKLRKTVSERVHRLVTWISLSPHEYVPFGRKSFLKIVSREFSQLNLIIKFNDFNGSNNFAMKIIVMNTFEHKREGIRLALIKMIRAQILKTAKTTHEAGALPGYENFNFHFKMPGCEINSKWSETTGTCKLCIKAKRDQPQG